MGCWHETCMLTQTPIYHYDPVVMVVIRQGALGWVSDGTFAMTVERLDAGEYNDYG